MKISDEAVEAASAGDGGLREALKEFQSTLEELLALGPVGDNGDVTWGLGYNRSTEHTLAAVRKMLAAAPAVPQPPEVSTVDVSAVSPVDREAIEDAIRDELLPLLGLELANPLSIDAANAVLAVLAGGGQS